MANEDTVPRNVPASPPVNIEIPINSDDTEDDGGFEENQNQRVKAIRKRAPQTANSNAHETDELNVPVRVVQRQQQQQQQQAQASQDDDDESNIIFILYYLLTLVKSK